MTFRNWALAGKGASLTMGVLFNLRYTALFTRRTSAKNFFEECQEAIHAATNYFAEVGLVINPDTPVEPYGELPIKVVQCMGIHPGFSGQPFLESAYATIERRERAKAFVVVNR